MTTDDGDSVTRFLWPDDQAGPWRLALIWGELAGRVECVGVLVESADRDRPVTTYTLSRIPLGRLIHDQRQQRFETLTDIAASAPDDVADRAARLLPIYRAKRGRGGRPREVTDDEWRARAQVVRELELRHLPLVAGLKDRYANYTSDALRKWPAKARRMDLDHGWGIFPSRTPSPDQEPTP